MRHRLDAFVVTFTNYGLLEDQVSSGGGRGGIGGPTEQISTVCSQPPLTRRE